MKKTTFYTILYFLLLVPFFKPPYFGVVSEMISSIYNICQIISAVITAFLDF